MHTRPPAVAGMFYPDKPQELAAAVRSYVAEATPPDLKGPPKGVIAPHAGYIYSGPIAGTAYAVLAARGKDIERAILFGPAHRVAFPGVAATGAAAFDTPLGPLPVDREAIALLVKEGHVREFERAHESEHSLEVQLPFLKQVCPNARIVPLLAGDYEWRPVERVLDVLWGGDETAIIVSSDLSHYHDYATAQNLDSDTAKTVERLGAGQIDQEQACGATCINGLLSVVASKGLGCTTLDLRNSGDTAGPRNRVVGYGAFAVA
ncbi:MAG: AmmeMemoRadiSam system protein B [Deltaproteobacteria bacterium]|jgi:AmmeMemoRadiSam system protein B|nr:AmmeMemoRadiSam system protein B [Deltaproteobacteria bacterium]